MACLEGLDDGTHACPSVVFCFPHPCSCAWSSLECITDCQLHAPRAECSVMQHEAQTRGLPWPRPLDAYVRQVSHASDKADGIMRNFAG